MRWHSIQSIWKKLVNLRPVWAVVLLVVIVASVGCNQDGENPYVLWQKYSHPDGAFTFYYMAPPFNVAPESTDAHPVVVVDAYATPTEGYLDARVRVDAWVSEDFCREEMQNRKAHWQSLGYDIGRNISYFNYFGDEGVLLEVSWQDHWAKDLFFSYGEDCVAISAWTDERGTKEDIEFLLAGFRPGDPP